jgi:hypothetical protein
VRDAGPSPSRPRDRILLVDALRKDDLERARTTTSGEKLRQALELMQLGIDLKRRKLRAADRTASEQEIDARLLGWMSAAR